ncbi:uncharacterized protein LOC128035547 [Gossypium raimondii]|uniref:uncharacterized protein LOC128035547 n=1 Tax=Gossypium raimondii TaxID=29730 RepID=UPI00227CFE43|nr:uncharacterized protein LOC128035547 [Gossypium raimondii]
MVSSADAARAFPMLMSSPMSGRIVYGGRGRSYRGHVQCQIYGRHGNLAQRCYYHFDLQYDGFSTPALLRGTATGQEMAGFQLDAATKGFFNPNSGPPLGYSARPSVNHMTLNGQVRLQVGPACVLQASHVDRHAARGGASWTLQPDMRRLIGPALVGVAPFGEFGQGTPISPQSCVGFSRILDFLGSKFSSGNTSNATAFGFAYGPNFENPTINHVEPYVPLPIINNASTSWYPDSGATNHMCQAALALNTSTRYSDMKLLSVSFSCTEWLILNLGKTLNTFKAIRVASFDHSHLY